MSTLKRICSVFVMLLASMFLLFILISKFPNKGKDVALNSESAIDERYSVVQNLAIENVFRWEQPDGAYFVCIASRTLKDNADGPGVELNIYSQQGKILYQQRLGNLGAIKRIYAVYALRENDPQLAVEVNSGGSDNELYLLDYRDDHIVNLVESVETDFNVSCVIQPQLQAIKDIRRLPFRIFLTSQIASFSYPETEILSYEGDKYVYIGKVQASKIANYSEKLLGD
jgi:hypothetical protein